MASAVWRLVELISQDMLLERLDQFQIRCRQVTTFKIRKPWVISLYIHLSGILRFGLMLKIMLIFPRSIILVCTIFASSSRTTFQKVVDRFMHGASVRRKHNCKSSQLEFQFEEKVLVRTLWMRARRPKRIRSRCKRCNSHCVLLFECWFCQQKTDQSNPQEFSGRLPEFVFHLISSTFRPRWRLRFPSQSLPVLY